MDEMLKKQDVLDAIYATMEKTDKPDVVLGLAAAMSTVKQMQAATVNPAEKQEASYNSIKTELEPCDDCIRREDALMALTGQCADSLIEILPKAIKRINKLPPVTPAEKHEPCKDTISREAVIDIIEDVCPIYGNDYRYILRDKVNELPPVTAEKVGHWILLNECSNSGYYCSECRKRVVKEGWSDTVKIIKYCPNCGCKVQEVKE